VPHHEGTQLWDLLDLLASRCYCRLDASYEPTIAKMEVRCQEGIVSA
jgi:hypothetical protein